MARPQAAGIGTASNMKGIYEYIFKQSRTADKGWSSGLGFGEVLYNSSPQTLALLEKMNTCLGPGLLLWYDLSNEKGT
jgi:hypothetical protein